MSEDKKPKKQSLPHTRAVQRDRTKRATGMPPDEVLVEQMAAVIHPAVYAQMDVYYAMGLRARILTLPVMVGLMLGLLWQQLGSVREAVRVLHKEGMLWVEPLEGVTAQALLERMSTLPAVLFWRVLLECLPQMQARAQQRQRPLPPAVAWARQHFHSIWAFDGSSLDGLLKKCGLLRERPGPVLAGKLGTLLDVATQLPRFIWYEEDSQAHDTRFWPQVMGVVTAGCLLLLDKGLIDFTVFDQLTDQHAGFITRPKSNTQMQVSQVLSKTAALHDCQIVLGGPQTRCDHPMRLVKVLFHGKWYAYLTMSWTPLSSRPNAWWPCMTSAGGLRMPLMSSSGCWAWPTSTPVPSTVSIAGLDHLALVCLAGRPYRCLGRCLAAPLQGDFPGDGFSWFVSFYPSPP